MEHKFDTEVTLSASNSFGQTREVETTNVEVIVRLNGERGSFEFYDEETGGENWYAEGGLWFNGKELVDYDGIFELPKFVADKLEELGYDISML